MTGSWPPAWCICPSHPSTPHTWAASQLAACRACKLDPCTLCRPAVSTASLEGEKESQTMGLLSGRRRVSDVATKTKEVAMAITNRTLEAGTRLVATYKKQAYVCTVEKGEDGKLAYALEDGKRFTSPSAAGSAVMGGVACNGWRFWSVEGETPAPKAEKPAQAEPKAKAATKTKASKPKKQNGGNGKLLSRAASQEGAGEGRVRWFCNGCMESFLVEGEAEPEACPAGHKASDPELAAPVAEAE